MVGTESKLRRQYRLLPVFDASVASECFRSDEQNVHERIKAQAKAILKFKTLLYEQMPLLALRIGVYSMAPAV